jgi:hypothetical protein
VVNGIISAARLMSGHDPRLEAALASVQASGSGSIVELEFTLPAEFIDMARQMGLSAAPPAPEPFRSQLPARSSR